MVMVGGRCFVDRLAEVRTTTKAIEAQAIKIHPAAFPPMMLIQKENLPLVQILCTEGLKFVIAYQKKFALVAIENNINKYSDAEVSAYNAAISDYNSRCGSFRAIVLAICEFVRSQVEANRSTLVTQGLNILKSWHPYAPAVDTSTTAPTFPHLIRRQHIRNRHPPPTATHHLQPPP